MRSAVLAQSLLLLACSEPMPRDADASTRDGGAADAARPDAQADVEGTGEWALLLRRATLPELPPAGSREVPGLDLDGHVTASSSDPVGCYFEDWVAPARFVEVLGVDNRIPDVVAAARGINPGLDLNADIQQGINELDALLVLRVTRIGDAVDDGEVDVAIFQTELVGEPVYEPVVIDGATQMLLAPGQTFRALPESLIEGRPRTQIVGASLRGGRLHTPSVDFSLRLPARDLRMVQLELHGARLSGRISASSLTDALLAGHVRLEDVPATIDSLRLDPPPSPSTVAMIADQLADVDVDGDGPCEAISVGIEIEAVAATLIVD